VEVLKSVLIYLVDLKQQAPVFRHRLGYHRVGRQGLRYTFGPRENCPVITAEGYPLKERGRVLFAA